MSMRTFSFEHVCSDIKHTYKKFYGLHENVLICGVSATALQNTCAL
jgi:hypothetical protein